VRSGDFGLAPRNRDFSDPPVPVIVVTRQVLARTRLAQPSRRHLVVELKEAENRHEDGVKTAWWFSFDKVSSASCAVSLFDLAGTGPDMPCMRFKPSMVARRPGRSLEGHNSTPKVRLLVFLCGAQPSENDGPTFRAWPVV
jgi:hypothetical protein